MTTQDDWATEEVMGSEEWFMPEVATFGDRLTAAREQASMTQTDLARKLGVKKSTLLSWEDDLNEPRANRLQMLSGLLGVSLKWLLTGEGDDVDVDQEAASTDQAILAEVREIHTQLQNAAKRLAVLEKRLRKGA
ncbi:multiprotein-bridging factor 1 family protein [Cognatishimia sp.]|uniref:helix-turn-helix domain-containing protein n=1 Tax=Cognatishimia sp. TaxID=2211648 RepID=UPI003510EC10